MGMSASQARFLGLTARKTNVEFEGQQINQQRTTLSNQSANYYNDLLGMSVPVPPSVDDYTKAVYTFEDGALTNQVTAMIAQNNGKYTVSYLRTWKDDFSVVAATTSIVTRAGDDTFKVGASVLRKLGKFDETNMTTIKTVDSKITIDNETYDVTKKDDGYYIDKLTGENTEIALTEEEKANVKYYSRNAKTNDDGSQVKLIPTTAETKLTDTEVKTITTTQTVPTDEYLKTLSEDQLKNLLKEEEQYIALLQQKYGEGDYVVRYIKNSTTGEYNPYFYKSDDLKNAIYDDKTGNSQSNINCYTIGTETKTEEVKAVEGCEIEKDSSGRYIKISIPDATGKKIPYALTTSTVTDQDAYNDAMNQYEYEKYEYDQAIQEINSKIEIVQSQDKNLELRLKQLDTEQDAISTEIDAVQKVIEKNVESSFKTFG